VSTGRPRISKRSVFCLIRSGSLVPKHSPHTRSVTCTCTEYCYIMHVSSPISAFLQANTPKTQGLQKLFSCFPVAKERLHTWSVGCDFWTVSCKRSWMLRKMHTINNTDFIKNLILFSYNDKKPPDSRNNTISRNVLYNTISQNVLYSTILRNVLYNAHFNM
jgi:hypothetical protein